MTAVLALADIAPVLTETMSVDAAFRQFDTIERTVWMASTITDAGVRVFLTHDTRVLVVANMIAYVHHYASDLLAEAAFDLI